MNKINKIVLILFFFVCLIFLVPFSTFASSVYKARITDVKSVEEKNNVSFQIVEIEILDKRFESQKYNLSIPLDHLNKRFVRRGEKLFVNFYEIDGSFVFEFVEFDQSELIIILSGFLFLLVFLILGFKGLKTLIPVLIFFVTIILNIFPQVDEKFDFYKNFLILIVILIFSITISSLLRIRNVFVSLLSILSVIFSITFEFFVSLLLVNQFQIINLFNVDNFKQIYLFSSMLFGFGAISNIAIQNLKQLKEIFDLIGYASLKTLFKEGFRAFPKICSAEINNLFFSSIGAFLPSIFIFKQKSPIFWFFEGILPLILALLASSVLAILFVGPFSSTVYVLFSYLLHKKKKNYQS